MSKLEDKLNDIFDNYGKRPATSFKLDAIKDIMDLIKDTGLEVIGEDESLKGIINYQAIGIKNTLKSEQKQKLEELINE